MPFAQGAPAVSGRRWPRYVAAAAFVLLLVGTLGAVKAAQIGTLMHFGAAAKKAGPPPEVVNSDVAVQLKWPGALSAIATVVSTRGVVLGNDAPGVVSRIAFESGAQVRAGQVLVELDSSVERAQLVSVKAREKLAQTSVTRTDNLVRAGAIAPAELDSARATLESLQADAKALEAQIARKIVRAPFSGKLGLRQINLGQYLAPGTPVTVLESERSTTLDFSLPQQELARLSVGMPVRALEEIDGQLMAEGSVVAIDPNVDPVTRAVKVRASLRDEDGRLRPGMYVRAEVPLPATAAVVAIPATAVIRAPYGDSVFIVEPVTDGGRPHLDSAGKPRVRARQQFVRLGAAKGDLVAVLEGVTAGQTIVTQGAFKLRNGAPILVDNTIRITPELLPRPQNG